ncbi:GGDEF domain-containing protein [Methylomonas montana]|uniref:GGDEF domain-containing protein n=1 Tax=Methylomonas montana TaxID=3058963 RepID=UPI00265A94B4|nr:GGDEF domain-containing protein [Methylomonas montana]WKJ90575.1 GGDEF domain-containing protein [Methylomonas montana]
MNPYHQDNFEEAFEHLRLATSLLGKHNVAPSPINYRVGYDYVAGKNQELNAALDKLVGQSEELTAEQLWILYQQFFSQDAITLEKIRQELHHIIISVQGAVERSSGNLSVYTHTLNRFAQILDPSTPLNAVASEVQKVLDDTRSMEQNQQRVESEISLVLAEVESLRKDLEKIKEESMMDALTGIPNRKAFDAALEQAVISAREQKSPLCILMIDIDFFKKFNDTYGHLVGDKVLRYVGAALKRCLKGRDMAARFGGEEFTVILPQTSLIGAGVIAEQIRNAISMGSIKSKSNGRYYDKVTVSIGVAQFRDNELPNDLLQRADKVLYIAKENGRNRVEKAL